MAREGNNASPTGEVSFSLFPGCFALSCPTQIAAATSIYTMQYKCRGRESNPPRMDFQSIALPTELPRHTLICPIESKIFYQNNHWIQFKSLGLTLAYARDWIQSIASRLWFQRRITMMNGINPHLSLMFTYIP